jgi:Leucine-rich repeat (LRR) protein/WD40 repeat protein
MNKDNLPVLLPDQNSALSLRRSNQLMDITDQILARARRELTVHEESWMARLWAWADENGVPDLEWFASNYFDKGGYWRGLPLEREALLGLTELRLDKMELATLPSEIGRLQQLQSLILLNNQLTTLPPEIGQLQQLQTLELWGNQLITLPPDIGLLRQLQELSIHINNITSLPPEIGQLQQLQTLELWGNQLTMLPPEIGQLQQLRTLNLGGITGGLLTTLPPEIGLLQQLRALNLESNHLTTLPSEIGQLQQLQKLKLRGNQLTSLPHEIGRLQQLQELDLSQNQLTTLPSQIGQLLQLQRLSLRHNQLTALPPEIGQLQQLQALWIERDCLHLLPTVLLLNDGLKILVPDEIPMEYRFRVVNEILARSRQELAASPQVAVAGEPPAVPILRIDPGEHTAMIYRIAADATGRWLVTASLDKTARVWSLADGKLLTTLRPPIRGGNEGKLFAVTMSPDGQTVAVGGWAGYEWDKSFSIYLFDSASGHLLRRLTGLPQVVNHLAFSTDGSSLAAMLGGSNGLRLFDVADGRLLGEDRDYGEASYSVDFRPDGRRLVTTSWDGQVRLYRWESNRLQLLVKQAAYGGKKPFSASFSPDGRRIAVVFVDTAAVNVLDGENLRLIFAPETAGVNNHLSSVAWSRAGDALFAAGVAVQNNRRFIRRWAIDRNRASHPLDWPVASNTIMDLAPLPDGRLAFGSGAPEWGVVTASGQLALFHAPAVADFRGMYEGFRLSRNAAQVRFDYEYGGKSPTVFDSQTRDFLAADTAGLSAPSLSACGLEVSDWKNTTAPKLNGQPLQLKPNENSRSLTLFPESAGARHAFVLGTEWRLCAFDRTGSETWQQPAESGVVWAVNVSSDGRWVVAAYSDGTIRWHRATDGVEQMAFYPHPDKKRWVLWTPSGYYDASPDGENLIGWHVNNGKDTAADFFPAGRFRDRFYRPDVLSKVLHTQDEAEALRLANAESGRRTQQTSIADVLPPVVSLLSHRHGDRFETGKQMLRYSVRSPADAPFTNIKVLVDGRPLELQHSWRPARVTEEQHLEITLPERDLELSLIAENKHGASVAASAQLVFAGRT